jgi:hypothetical protein
MPRENGGPPPERQCSELVRGDRCQQWSVKGTDPAKCPAHAGMGGRGNKRTPGLQPDELERARVLLRGGNYVETVAHALGYRPAVLQGWIDAGAAGDPAHESLWLAVQQARAESEARNVTIVASAARESWQAAAWMLERTAPERWARVTQRETARELEKAETSKSDPFAEVDELASRRRP